MAKQIKVIKCPNCGSVQKKELKEDHYRCDNCNTDYFLDNDDINININDTSSQNKSTATQSTNSANKTIIIIIAAVVFALIVIYASLPSHNNTPSRPVTQQRPTAISQQTKPQTPPTAQEPAKKQYRTTYEYCSTIVANDRAYVLSLEKRSYSTNDNQFYFVIYDLLKEKPIKETLLENIQANKNGQFKWEYADFSANRSYFILNNRDVYLLDKNTYTFNQVNKTLLDHHPEYQTGIASVTISRTSAIPSGNTLHILTNDGKKAYYYPIIDEIYEDNYDYHMFKNRPAKPAEDTTPHTVYGFAHNYGQDNKLIKFTYITYDGVNHYELRSSKVGNQKLGISRSETHTDADSAYDIINNSNVQSNQIVDHKNLTPGRLYFDPSVIFFDDNSLIIKAKMNAAPDADYNYQRIDINNGNVLWTIPDDKITIKEMTAFDGNFIAKTACDKYTIIDADGKLIKQIILKGN